ncbi:MAG: hypothetical protein ACP5UH_03730 [Candidatus Micrarchaeia archaeon]
MLGKQNGSIVYLSKNDRNLQFFLYILRRDDPHSDQAANDTAAIAYGSKYAVPVMVQEAKALMDKNSLTWNLEVRGTYENIVKGWLLSNSVPALYELGLVDGTYEQHPDFILAARDKSGKIVIWNPHSRIDNIKFLAEQWSLAYAGFHVVVIYKKFELHGVELGTKGGAIEFMRVNYRHAASSAVEAALSHKFSSYRAISADELLESLFNMSRIKPMYGDPQALLRK